MNIIILGCGKVGQKIAEILNAEKEHNITIIDNKTDVVHKVVNHYDIMGVAGNGTNLEVLEEAGIKNAEIFIAVTGSDELNLIACLMAQKLSGCSTIARVSTPDYYKAINILKNDIGLSLAINPEHAAATEIARVLKFPSAIQIDTFAKGRVEILKFKIPEDCILDSIKLYELKTKLDCDVLVCGVERDAEVFIPGGNFELKSGDYISLVASVREATNFFKCIGIKTNRAKNAIVVGGGDISYYLCRQLIQMGINVKIVEQDEKRCEELCEIIPKADIVNGDGTENQTLLEEGLETAEAFVSLTNVDEKNIFLSLYAKSKSDAKVVTKVNRIEYGEIIENMDLGTIVHPKDITAEYIVRFIRAKKNTIGSNIETMHFILDGKAEALEFRIKNGSPVAGIALESLNLKDNILIACINRNGNVIIPRGKDVIMPGDTVIVVTLRAGFKDISDILK